MTGTARPRLLVSPDQARRLIQERVDAASTLGGRLIDDRDDLGELESDLRDWVDATADILARTVSPAAIIEAFCEPPPPPSVATKGHLYEEVGAVQAARGVYVERLRQIQGELPRYASPLPRGLRVPRLSLDDISNKVVGTVIATLLLGVGSILVAFVVRPGGTTDDSNLPTGSANTTSHSAPAASQSPDVIPSPTASQLLAGSPNPSASTSGLDYQVDWSAGAAGWSGTEEWTVIDGHAYNDGTPSYDSGQEPTFGPPIELPLGDVAIEADIRLIRVSDSVGPFHSFGISARATATGSYAVGYCDNCNARPEIVLSNDRFEAPLAAVPFDPEGAWHTYRVEFRGPAIAVFIDGSEILNQVDTMFVDGTGVGLWASGCAVEVRSFRVTSPGA